MLPYDRRLSWSGNRAGQALLVAVLLMMVILLTGILFVAIVSYNQQQSWRSSDVVLAQTLAEAGIRWCNENLTHSPQGADWRPPFKPLDSSFNQTDPSTWPVPPVQDTNGNDYGTFGLDLALHPGNPAEAEDTGDDYYSDFERAHNWHGLVDAATGAYIRFGFYRIPDVNNPRSGVILPKELTELGGKGHILVRVTYDPDPPYEPEDGPSPTPDELSANIKIESIGVVDETAPVYRYLVAYKPIGLTDNLFFVTDKTGSGRPAKIGFNPRVDMDNDGVGDWLEQAFFGPLKFNTKLQLYGDNGAGGAPTGASTQIVLTPQPTTATQEVPGMNPLTITGGYLRRDRVEAQGIEEAPGASATTAVRERAANGALGPPRQLVPTSPSFDTINGLVMDGETSTDSAGFSRSCKPLTPPELGIRGGTDRYRILTRDSGAVVTLASGETVNLGRYGFGRGIYVDNVADLQYVDNDGTHDLDALIAEWMQNFPDEFSRENSGWNPTLTTYTPPGVEVTLYPTEQAALEFGRLTASPTPDNRPGVIWWPNHVPGEPGIRLTRSDRTWRWYDSSAGVIRDSGEMTLYLDYPAFPNQVIFAEGNIRVRGVLPRNDANRVSRTLRDYNLTLVSGGTIYIDGQILCPQDIFGRDPGSGNIPAPDGPCPDEYNSKVALLAHDCVVLNTTRIVPQLTSGSVSVAPDDPINPVPEEQHWVLSPEVAGAVYSSWYFGEPVLPGHSIGLSALHTAADPGPCAITMSIFNDMTGTMTRYDFDPGGSGQNRFYFVGEGVLPPANWVDFALAPNWGRLWSAANPAVPWNLRNYLNDGAYPAPGVLKSVAISAADPAIPGSGGGATEYWIKKWKITEEDAAGNPVGAVHAKVNALIYAENGCWFVIPGPYFDPTQTGAMAVRFRRYNYDICVRGMITECFHAEPEMVREWSDKWAWPTPSGAWVTLRYEFDESLRVARGQWLTTLAGTVRSSAGILPVEQANLPKLPLLPVSKDLLFYGEGI